MDPTSRLASALRESLASADSDDALIALSERPDVLANVPMGRDQYGMPRPHDLAGVAIHMMAVAMIRLGRSPRARPFIDACAGIFEWGHRHYRRMTDYDDLVIACPFLWVPGIEASLAERDWAGAMTAILSFDALTARGETRGAPTDPAAIAVAGDPRAATYGPFARDRRWMLERQETVWRSGALDPRLEETRAFFQLFLENALAIGEPSRGLPLIEAQGLGPVPVSSTTGGHFEFDGICVLAALGRLDEAMDAAKKIVRDGYSLVWRFDLEAAARMQWTQDMRQNEWLATLAATPSYRRFLRDDVAYDPAPADDPDRAAISALREDVWRGKAKKRCWISRQPIGEGDPVVRMRRLYAHASDGGFDIAEKAAFETSGWVQARRRFEADAIPLACLFPRERTWDTPAIAAFHYDIARDPAAFDLDRAIAIVADHAPNPIRHEWSDGEEVSLAFEPLVDDAGHGDAVNFAWRLLKAGFAREIFSRVAKLDRARSDKVFAMLAVFDRADCRAAAAAHFELLDLPAMMETAFVERPTLEAHLAMADFAAEQPRWRAGLASAMRAYALHLFSNYHPGVDWFLQDLEHFNRARGCQLLYFLIHHPQDDAVLAAMIERECVPSGVGTGGFDAYDNASSFYVRTALFNRMIHAPDRLGFWLGVEVENGRKGRETRRLYDQYRRREAAAVKTRKPKRA